MFSINERALNESACAGREIYKLKSPPPSTSLALLRFCLPSLTLLRTFPPDPEPSNLMGGAMVH